MALSLPQKLTRMLRFLVACQNPRVMLMLSQRGFTKAVLEEGWTVFYTAAGRQLSYKSAAGAISDEMNTRLAALDQWENTWFPVIAATLERHYPAVYQRVFLNLAQATGLEVVVTTSTMLARLKEESGSKEGTAALKLLESRGLTDSVLAKCSDLLDEVKAAGEATPLEVDEDSQKEQEQAAQDAWAWHREWSQIARTLITRGDLLIQMGLRKTGRKTADDDTGDEEETATPVAPAVPVTPNKDGDE